MRFPKSPIVSFLLHSCVYHETERNEEESFLRGLNKEVHVIHMVMHMLWINNESAGRRLSLYDLIVFCGASNSTDVQAV